MSKKYVNVPQDSTGFTLIKSGFYTQSGKNYKQETGDINSILITTTEENNSCEVDVFLEDINNTDNDYFIINKVILPPGASILLEDNVSFNIEKYCLKINSSHTVTVIIT
jgi:hypothetical protein